MNPNEYIFDLVKETIANTSLKLSDLVRLSCRIARLRNDYLNLLWLEYELINVTDETQRNLVDGFVTNEIINTITDERIAYSRKVFIDIWCNDRKFYELDKDLKQREMIFCKGVILIENNIAHWTNYADDTSNQQRQKIIARNQINQSKNILGRIKNRVLMYLSNIEKHLIFGQLQSNIFEENRNYVDKKLTELCPDVLNKFVSAYKRLGEDNPESWAQALTSCRRLLESLADTLYPATDKIIIGSDKKERKLTKDKLINRLWQYLSENIPKSTSGKLLQVNIEDYGNRIDKLYAITNKGVHAEISKFEVNQCVIQTYLMIGDLLRIKEEISTVTKNSNN